MKWFEFEVASGGKSNAYQDLTRFLFRHIQIECDGDEKFMFPANALDRYVSIPSVNFLYVWVGTHWLIIDMKFFVAKFKNHLIRHLDLATLDMSDNRQSKYLEWFLNEISKPNNYFKNTEFVSFNNGMVNTTTKRLEYSWENYEGVLPNSLAFIDANFKSLDELRDTPTWDKFWITYPQAAEAIERHIKNIIIRNVEDQQYLMLIGPRQTGKTTATAPFLNRMRSMFALASFQQLRDYHTSLLMGKRAIFCNDHPEHEMDEMALATSKNMVEIIPILIRAIYGAPFEYDHEGYDGVVTTNKPMGIPGGTSIDAWLRRWEMVVMDSNVKPDPKFRAGIEAEMDDIISQILHRDYVPYRIYFSSRRDDEIEKRYKIYKYWRNHAYMAIEDLFFISRNPNDVMDTTDVDQEVANWLRDHRLGRSLKPKILSGQIVEALTEMGVPRKQKQIDGVRTLSYVGICRKDETNRYSMEELIEASASKGIEFDPHCLEGF